MTAGRQGMTPNVQLLLSELEKQTANLNKEMHYRKQAEFLAHNHIKTLESKTKELRLFANVAAHTLQEPLKIIETELKSIRSHYEHPNEHNDLVSHFLHLIESSTDRMRFLIDSYWEYSLTQLDTAQFSEISLKTILESAITSMAELIEKNKAILTYSPAPIKNWPFISGNDQQITAVFQQLITNAINFCSARAPIQMNLSLEIENGLYLFSINDNGRGIHPKHFEQIFWVIKPDEKLGEYKRNTIGLAICKKIIEHHGGKIWVSSQPHEGSTFYISLPIPVQSHSLRDARSH
jgi:chemotaxis family two-component system sensor kinase Cph1